MARTTTTSGTGTSSDVVVQVEAGPVVPSFFVCPISLELMTDPVTLSTGMTYDRASIEKWIGIGHNTCPTTNQVLESDAPQLIPNHTLRRLIHNWCVANQSGDVERIVIPTPKSTRPGRTETAHQLLNTITMSTTAQCRAPLRKLLSLAEESERHRKCIADAGAVPILAAALADMSMGMDTDPAPCEEALSVIALLHLSEGDKKALSNPATLAALAQFLSTPGVTTEAKVNAADVLHVLCDDHDARLKVAVGDIPGVIRGLVELLRKLDARAAQSALRCLLALSLPRRNRVATIEGGAIPVLVELLPGTEKRNKELAFGLLEVLANCAEGREAIANTQSAIPVIVKSMLGVSHRATEHAVAALWVVLSYASNRTVINTALQAGAFTNLLMLLPSECSPRAKLKARDCLKLLNEVWGSYTCRVADESNIVGVKYVKRNMGHLRFSTELI